MSAIDLRQIRRENLRHLIKIRGGANALAKALGYANASFLSQMAGPNPMREVTEKTARQIEESLGIAPGVLDTVDPDISYPMSVASMPPEWMDLSQAIQASFGELDAERLRQLSREKFLTVCQMIFDEHQREGVVSADFAKRIALLLA